MCRTGRHLSNFEKLSWFLIFRRGKKRLKETAVELEVEEGGRGSSGLLVPLYFLAGGGSVSRLPLVT